MSLSCAPTKSSILDHLAISMAVICAIHCLVTPVLLVALPILATTFWVDEHFHIWMLLLVIPTTSLAMFSGCRKHRDRLVVVLALLGVGLLIAALLGERALHAEQLATQSTLTASGLAAGSETSSEAAGCCVAGHCALTSSDANEPSTDDSGIPWPPLLNTLGGVLLVAGHTRNFLLCRKSKCTH
ncbi:MerC domain-containing protein [Cerasicoccus frondis]|uniref:MerC domain-containing protein n=1 Tax=Cerasicoccus frondis TaxID=490090 RepID=UPI0028524EE7|nr:MerC domain-containing protein [Cerasicoccus frondis]